MPKYSIKINSEIDPRTQVGDYLISYSSTPHLEGYQTTQITGIVEDYFASGYPGPEFQVFGQSGFNLSSQFDGNEYIKPDDLSTVGPNTPSLKNKMWNQIAFLGEIIALNFDHNIIVVDITTDANITDLTVGRKLSVIKNDFIERSGVKGSFMTVKLETNSTSKKEIFQVGSNVIVNSK
jgi:hypothetical protein